MNEQSSAINVQNFKPEKPHSLFPISHSNTQNREYTYPGFYFTTCSNYVIKQGKFDQNNMDS